MIHSKREAKPSPADGAPSNGGQNIVRPLRSLVIQIFFHGYPGGQVDSTDCFLPGAAPGPGRLAAQLDHYQDGDADDQDPEEGVHKCARSKKQRLSIHASREYFNISKESL